MIKESEFTAKLTTVFKKNGMTSLLNSDRASKLYKLTEYMLAENEKYNLTAITEPDKIILSHYADCATLAKRLPKGIRVADIGCGAGFPTLPLAILRDDLSITAVDSTAKRIEYVRSAAEMLGITNVTPIAMRAEDGGKNPEFREKFDVATARAVAEMRVLSELCLPYVRKGGSFIAMKGKNAEYELSAAARAIAMLGGAKPIVETVALVSDTEELSHPLIIVTKKDKTPDKYPRPFAQISKKPL